MAGQFQGFDNPEENWSKLPHALIDLFPWIQTVAELKIVLYVLRHTWGFGEYDGDGKRITLDEFSEGRKRRDGSRLDNGTGLSPNAVKAGVRAAVRHGFLIREDDGRDAARSSHKYRLRMTGATVSEIDTQEDGTLSKFDTLPSKFDTLPSKFDTRSEKDTSETNQSKTPTPEAPQAAPTAGVGVDASLSEADADTEAEAAFTEMCGELSERLGLVISATLRAKLRQAYDADGGRRLRGLYEHATTAPNLTNPAGVFVRWIDDGPTLASLPSAVHNRCKPQPWYGYTDQATGEWVAAGPKPTRWGRYPDAAPEAATVQAGDGERLYSIVGPDGETRDYTSAELEGLRGKAADRQELETRDRWHIHG